MKAKRALPLARAGCPCGCCGLCCKQAGRKDKAKASAKPQR